MNNLSQQADRKILPDNLYDDMLRFFRRTSLPRIQQQRHEDIAQNKNASDKKIS